MKGDGPSEDEKTLYFNWPTDKFILGLEDMAKHGQTPDEGQRMEFTIQKSSWWPRLEVQN